MNRALSGVNTSMVLPSSSTNLNLSREIFFISRPLYPSLNCLMLPGYSPRSRYMTRLDSMNAVRTIEKVTF